MKRCQLKKKKKKEKKNYAKRCRSDIYILDLLVGLVQVSISDLCFDLCTTPALELGFPSVC